jgi:hypothetical protein
MKTMFLIIAIAFVTGCALPYETYSFDSYHYTNQRVGKVMSVRPITRKEYVNDHPRNIEPCIWRLQRERRWGYLSDALTKRRYQSVCYDHKYGNSYGVIRYVTGFSVRLNAQGYKKTIRLDYAPALGSYIRY